MQNHYLHRQIQIVPYQVHMILVVLKPNERGCTFYYENMISLCNIQQKYSFIVVLWAQKNNTTKV